MLCSSVGIAQEADETIALHGESPRFFFFFTGKRLLPFLQKKNDLPHLLCQAAGWEHRG